MSRRSSAPRRGGSAPAIHAAAAAKFSDAFKRLNETAKNVSTDPAYKEVFVKTAGPWEAVAYGDREVCTKYALGMIELAKRYEPLLTAKKK